jgi:hypothetical protein
VSTNRTFFDGSAGQRAYGEVTLTCATDLDSRRTNQAPGARRIGAHNHGFQPAAQRSKIGNARGTTHCGRPNNARDEKEQMDA